MRAALAAWVLGGLIVAVAHAEPAPLQEAIERNNRGAALLKEGKKTEAIAEFRKAVELAPAHATAQANLAYAYEQSGQLEEAMAAYQKLLELEPKNATARNNLAALYSRSGRHDDAIREFEALIDRDPADATARRNLETAKRNKGILDEREQRSGGAIKTAEARPDDPRAAYDVARVYAQQGDLDKALAWLKRALDLGYEQVDFLQVDPAMTGVRSDPRFGKLMEGRGSR